MHESLFHGVPRSKIPWYPTINYEKCLSCGKCVNYCKHDVYGVEEKQGKRMPLRNADTCIVYCDGCDDICPSGAISHPSKLETGKIISKLSPQKSSYFDYYISRSHLFSLLFLSLQFFQ